MAGRSLCKWQAFVTLPKVVEGDSWDNLELDFDWRKMSANHRRLGLNSEMFIFMSPEGDIEGDQNGHILYINAAYVEEIAEEDRERYLETMIEVAMMLGAERHRAEIEMRKTLSFMVEFREVSDLFPVPSLSVKLKLTFRYQRSISGDSRWRQRSTKTY